MLHPGVFRAWRWLPACAIVLWLLALHLGVSQAPARAAGLDATPTSTPMGAARFGIQPVGYDPSEPQTQSYFIFDTQPGKVIHSQARVTNSGDASGVVALAPVDAATGQTSGVVFLTGQAARHAVGAWLTLSAARLTLAPGDSAILDFTLSVPANARAGQYVGGIIAQNVDPFTSPNKSALHITIQEVNAIAVEVNLPGQANPQLALTRVSAENAHGYQHILLALANRGNMLLRPVGELRIYNADKRLVMRTSLALDTLLPLTAITYPVSVTQRALQPGAYTARLTLTYGALTPADQLAHPAQASHLDTTLSFEISQAAVPNATQTYLAPPPLFGAHASLASSWTIFGVILILAILIGLALGRYPWGRKFSLAGAEQAIVLGKAPQPTTARGSKRTPPAQRSTTHPASPRTHSGKRVKRMGKRSRKRLR